MNFLSLLALRTKGPFKSLLLFCVAGLLTASGEGVTRLRSWTIEDSIANRYFSTSISQPNAWGGDGAVFHYSDDKRYAFYTTIRGNPLNGNTIGELTVFDLLSLSRYLAQKEPRLVPLPLCKISVEGSCINQAPISDARWAPDLPQISFLASLGENRYELRVLNVMDGTVKVWAESDATLRLRSFNGKSAIWRSSVRTQSMPAGRTDIFEEVGRDEAGLAVSTFPRSGEFSFLHQYWIKNGDRAPLDLGKNSLFVNTWLSNDGAHMTALGSDGTPGKDKFSLVDLAKGDWAIIADTPHLTAASPLEMQRLSPKAVWVDDKTCVLFSPTRLFGPGLDSTGSFLAILCITPGSPPTLTSFRPRLPVDGKDELEITGVDLSSAKESFVVSAREATGRKLKLGYRFKASGWLLDSTVSVVEPKLISPNFVSLSLREDANTPPSVIATQGSNSTVIDPAPSWLQEVEVLPSETFQWTEEDGKVVLGGITRPRSGSFTGKAPLVVVVAEYRAGRFLPDSGTPSGYLVQSLAAQGYIVAQIPMVPFIQRTSAEFSTEHLEAKSLEGPRFVARIEAAVKQLIATHSADSTKMAIMGFSRRGHQILYLLTHPRTLHFSAATCLDSFTGTFPVYLQDAALPGQARQTVFQYEALHSGAFWSNKSDWFEHESSFNFDRIRTPIFYVKNSQNIYSVAYWSDSYIGGLRLLGKPLEYLSFPGAPHNMVSAKQRHALLSANTEWINFWLRNEEPKDPVRAKRWAHLREQQDEVLKTPPPPKGKWVFVPEDASITSK